MMCRMMLSCLAAAVALSQPAWAASDPFLGKWKLDVPRSTIVDDFQVKALGSNRYAFSFEGGPTETVIADGTDQPGLPGNTLAARAIDPRKFTVVRKRDGRVIVSAIWTLSSDGRSLHDDFTSVQPDGSRTTTHYFYKRLSGRSGFAGAWESITPPAGLNIEIRFAPLGGNGLLLVTPGGEKRLVFDRRDHVVPGADGNAALSARRSGSRRIEYTDKSGGKIQAVHRFEVSADGRTLTEILQPAGQVRPDILAFARE